jgi:hypothetical protein
MSQYSFVNYTGNGATTQFIIPFQYLAQSHVKVTVDGVEKTRGVDFSISDGKIILVSAPASGKVVRIYRQTPRATEERVVDYTSGAGLNEADLDNGVLQNLFINQEVLDGIGRGVRLDDTDTSSLTSLPSVTGRAERLLGFDVAGNPTIPAITLTQLQLLVERNPIGLLADVTDYGLLTDGVILASADYGTLS